MNGPKKMSREERLHIAHEIAARILEKYGSDVKAIGIYGSLARQTDGPFSDIEMLCVLRSSGEEYNHEWSAGDWKAEVNFDSEDVLLEFVATVEGDWPLTHGAFFSVLPLYDPESFFTVLLRTAESPNDAAFRQAISGLLVEELYEYVGKWRNASVMGPKSFLPSLAVAVAKAGAMLIGLHNKTYYTTSATVLPEALNQPTRPDGFDRLCQLVMTGELSDSEAIIEALEDFWQGVVNWSAGHGYAINQSERIPF